MAADPELDFPSRQPISREEAWHRLMRYAGHWALLGYGNFAVIEKSSGQYVGETGLWDAHRGMGDTSMGMMKRAGLLPPAYTEAAMHSRPPMQRIDGMQ